MAPVAVTAFSLQGVTIAQGADFAGYSAGTKRWLLERGLSVAGPTLTAGKAHDGIAVGGAITVSNYSHQVLRRLIARGYIVGA
jgi:hypothetical protein